MEDKHDKGGVHWWKKYALEFLMMFLAVTLGFFAKNKPAEGQSNEASPADHCRLPL